ncbi:haloacid dehalogenase type II [Novosphingobium colocasiae]|uniref:Hydrolase n=1 Tax=Novosphingobium colocasiae TaxID=1256513 RepID=A0A918PH74_9SPHN|nr:haloacid dehalogenase type II [Novosphingobium colocasiae]GGZ07925.1 hydrolase [Novosphingobium colocasiae]
MTTISTTAALAFRPQYISFDCYGTLIRFRMSEMARAFFADRIPAEKLDHMAFVFSSYRFDETMGPWQPYRELLRNAVRRTAKAFGVEYREADADALYDAVPTWGPHDDVPGGLSKIADKIPLVILSNAMNEQIDRNVALLGAPFHRVYTAESAQAYKPRMQAFEYMFDQLGCGPEVMMHVSSSFRYDQNTATDLGFGCRVFVGRGHEPSNNHYRDVEIPHIGCLPAVVGL